MNFTKALLDWYDKNSRKLPWREQRDPYAIWLCEIIMQQTRIVQGLAYWERFMATFPTVEELAEADEDQVLKLWEGLGYYSRARNLHTAAKQIVAMGKFPDRLEDIRALKGVGDYTAAAIASIAFGLPVAVVDGNVYRVLARYFGLTTPIGSNAAKKEFTALAQSLLDENRPGDFNEAMMDFGAIQCTPQSPRCSDCPFALNCHAKQEGLQEQLPVKGKKTAIRERHLCYIYYRYEGQTAIHKRPAGDIWQGLWEPFLIEQTSHPTVQQPSQPSNDTTDTNTAGTNTTDTNTASANTTRGTLLGKDIRHQLTHQSLYADFYLYECAEKPQLPPDYIWVKEEDLKQYGKPRLVERLLELLPQGE